MKKATEGRGMSALSSHIAKEALKNSNFIIDPKSDLKKNTK